MASSMIAACLFDRYRFSKCNYLIVQWISLVVNIVCDSHANA